MARGDLTLESGLEFLALTSFFLGLMGRLYGYVGHLIERRWKEAPPDLDSMNNVQRFQVGKQKVWVRYADGWTRWGRRLLIAGAVFLALLLIVHWT